MRGLLGIQKAVRKLNPEQVRKLAARPVRVSIAAQSPEEYTRVHDALLGGLSDDRRRQSSELIFSNASGADLVVPPGAALDRWIEDVLHADPDLGPALSRSFPPFRTAYCRKVIADTCKENTLFSLATALPDVIPNLIELPWAIAEFASDTAFLTANQLRMAFLLAAASDHEIGYREQKAEIASVVAGAFGWRAIARQIVGKIPFGGGLIAKAAVAYAGTKVVGVSLERLYAIGYRYSREERDKMYADAMRQGRDVAFKLLKNLRPDLAKKLGATSSAA